MAQKKKVSSAVKAHRQNVKRRQQNRPKRSTLRTALKTVRTAIDEGNVEATAVGQTTSLVDKMASKGIIHRNTASRYKSRLARRLRRQQTPA